MPLIAALLGADQLVAVAVAIACGAIIMSPITLVILEKNADTPGDHGIGASLAKAFRKPLVIAPAVAVAFVMTGIDLPEPLA